MMMLSYRSNLSPPRPPPGQPALAARPAAHKPRRARRKLSPAATRRAVASRQKGAEIRRNAVAEETAPLCKEIGAEAERRTLADAFRDGRIDFEAFKMQLRDIRRRVRAGLSP